jgi:signal peptidase I
MSRKSGLTFYDDEKKFDREHLRNIAELAVSTVIIIFIACVIMFFFGMKTAVIGDSMEPTLYNGQSILIDRFIYIISSPRRNDVIVFMPNGNKNSHYYVKRVIGLPGETVLIRNGVIYINGTVLDENDRYDTIADPGIASDPVKLGKNEYFVLGDKRNSSEDSRSGNIGAVSKDMITGKAWFHMASGNSGMGLTK